MKTIDLNCDLGEQDDGLDIQLMPFVSSCNIACGGHAGHLMLMEKAVREAVRHRVKIGAHPGYPDQENFGRVSMKLGAHEMKELVHHQVSELKSVATRCGATLDYVKLHGAFYHDAARHEAVARAVMEAISGIDPQLCVLGLKGSFHEQEAVKAGLRFFSEGFADRRYDESGGLMPRNQPNNVLSEQETIEQLLNIVLEGIVYTTNGKKVKMDPNSICVHGDHPGSLAVAQGIMEALEKHQVAIKSFLDED